MEVNGQGGMNRRFEELEAENARLRQELTEANSRIKFLGEVAYPPRSEEHYRRLEVELQEAMVNFDPAGLERLLHEADVDVRQTA